MTGPSPGSLAGTCALVLVPSAVFNALVVPDVASKYSLAFTVVAIAWPLWCLSCLVAAGTTDPGIVRREPYRPPPEGRARARYKEERLPNGKSVTVKWNDTCNLYQPPRAHHCSVNDDCIDKFDHHCPWVGTTIGRRNYRPFLGFVFGTAILCVFVIATCALQIKIKYDELPADAQSRNLKAMGKAPAAMIVLFVSFLGFCFVGVLSCFHAYLVATNQTTYENFRDGYSWDENPYNKGLVGNCLEAWCSRAPPSRFRFRKPARSQPHPRRRRRRDEGGGGGRRRRGRRGRRRRARGAAAEGPGRSSHVPGDGARFCSHARVGSVHRGRAAATRRAGGGEGDEAEDRDGARERGRQDAGAHGSRRAGREGGGEGEGEGEGDAREESESEGGGTPASPGGYEGEGETNSRTRKYEDRM